jgi:hypothetical protein
VRDLVPSTGTEWEAKVGIVCLSLSFCVAVILGGDRVCILTSSPFVGFSWRLSISDLLIILSVGEVDAVQTILGESRSTPLVEVFFDVVVFFIILTGLCCRLKSRDE